MYTNGVVSKGITQFSMRCRTHCALSLDPVKVASHRWSSNGVLRLQVPLPWQTVILSIIFSNHNVPSEYSLLAQSSGECEKFTTWHSHPRVSSGCAAIDHQSYGRSCPNAACMPSKKRSVVNQVAALRHHHGSHVGNRMRREPHFKPAPIGPVAKIMPRHAQPQYESLCSQIYLKLGVFPSRIGRLEELRRCISGHPVWRSNQCHWLVRYSRWLRLYTSVWTRLITFVIADGPSHIELPWSHSPSGTARGCSTTMYKSKPPPASFEAIKCRVLFLILLLHLQNLLILSIFHKNEEVLGADIRACAGISIPGNFLPTHTGRHHCQRGCGTSRRVHIVQRGRPMRHATQCVVLTVKQTCICETKAKGWAGYVHMPSTYLADVEGTDPYNISMFFWYFEARNDPRNAKTAMYLAGGPGESSMYGATSDGGPCTILSDSNSTAENPWSWNEHVNMLYLDQPNQSGFSYDTLANSTMDLLFLGGDGFGITPFEDYNGTASANSTFYHGTLPSQNLAHTANNSVIAARTIWHFSQVWFSEFPEWKTDDKRISVWGNSYGGYWVSASAAYIQSQNSKVSSGALNASFLDLDTAGITNGCIDQLYQGGLYPQMAYNNTYGLQVISKDIYEEALNNFTKPDGCREQIVQCRELGDQYDPDQLATNATVNAVCVEATLYCAEFVLGAYSVFSNVCYFSSIGSGRRTSELTCSH